MFPARKREWFGLKVLYEGCSEKGAGAGRVVSGRQWHPKPSSRAVSLGLQWLYPQKAQARRYTSSKSGDLISSTWMFVICCRST
jgi:hypothetical protein